MLGDLGEHATHAPLLKEALSIDFDCILKVLIVGDSRVGKSQLFKRFADETFSDSHETTQSVEYRHRYIQFNSSERAFKCKVQVWDCISSASKAIMTSIYKGANAIILLVDMTNNESFGAIPDWLDEIRSFSSPKAAVYLVGTKLDSPSVCVSKEKGLAIAQSYRLPYTQVSSKTGENVDALFVKIVGDLQAETMTARDEKEDRLSIQNTNKHSYKKQKRTESEDSKDCSCCAIM
jgi:Ras-related protein Rab-8A